MVKRQQIVLPITNSDLRATYSNYYKDALSLKPLQQSPHYFYILVNMLLLLLEFNTLSLLLSIQKGGLFLLPISFSFYFILLYLSFIGISSIGYKKLLPLPITITHLMTLLSFTLFYLPVALFISYLTGPLAFIFVFACALINNYHCLLLITDMITIDSQRKYFFTSLAVLILSFLICYGGQMMYFSAVAQAM